MKKANTKLESIQKIYKERLIILLLLLFFFEYINASIKLNIGGDPGCTTVTSPANTATNVALNAQISWASAVNVAGYRISIGTTPGGINVVNNRELNSATTYTHSQNWNGNTTYYVRITVYDYTGTNLVCNETRFTTQIDNNALPCAFITPLEGEIGVSVRPTITWNNDNAPTNIAVNNYLSIGTTSGGEQFLVSEELSDQVSYTPIMDMQENTTYYITIDVRDKDTGDFIDTCESSFTTRRSLLSDFITTWKTTTPIETITIPTATTNIGTGYNYKVNWGDGTTDLTMYGGDASHAYTTAGNYQVAITGDFPRIYFNNTGDKRKIISIDQWGEQQWTSMNKAFHGCANLAGQATDIPNLSVATDISGMFIDAAVFNQDISTWNTSHIANMNYMFAGAFAFNQDIGSWNTAGVTNMSGMFVGARSFNQNIGSWNTASVMTMNRMFVGATLFDQNLGGWNVTSLLDAGSMFSGALSIANYDALLVGWNSQNLIPSVPFSGGSSKYCSDAAHAARANMMNATTGDGWSITDLGRDASCASSVEIPFITTWKTTVGSESITIPTFAGETYSYTVDWGDASAEILYTGDATHVYATAGDHQVVISGTFPRIYFNNGGDRNKIISIDQWGNQQWTSMESAFLGCTNLAGQATDNPDLSNVTDTSHMFQYTVYFDQDISSWNTSNITNMSSMFYSALSFRGAIGNWNTSNVTNMSYMFALSTSFNQNIGGWNTSKVTDMSGMFANVTAFNQDISNWDTARVINMSRMFNNAVNFNQNIGGWTTTNVTDMSYMFAAATNFNQNIGSWDTANVTNMQGMFYDAAAFNQDISTWNTAQVTLMTDMFRGAIVFNKNLQRNGSMWNTTNVTNMARMFDGATDFNGNIINWDIGIVTNTDGMFTNAVVFNQDISAWNTANVQTMIGMFSGATNFNQNIGTWTVTNLADANYMFLGATLSTNNYDALLVGWNNQNLNSNVHFSGGNSTYCSEAANVARANMINTTTGDSWVITDMGRKASCVVAITDFFITTWQTTTVNESITIPTATTNIGAGYNYTVNWGDGTAVTTHTGDATHAYVDAGDYRVTIGGTFPRIYFNNLGDKDKIIAINQWGNQQWTSMDRAFYGCSQLAGQAVDSPNLTVATDISNMFSGATLFNQNVSLWDTSHITDMHNTFNNASTFNQDISSWNTTNVTDMNFMFANATNFNQNIGSWNTGNVTNMNSMFANATNFNQNIGGWNTVRVIKMRFMFANATNFNQNIGSWNTTNVMDMSSMFYNATNFNQNIGLWNTGNVMDMSSMFTRAINFNQNIGGWNTANTVNMSSMFFGATNFNQNIGLWNTGIVTEMQNMFYEATNFNQNIGSWNTGRVTNMHYMFGSATSFDQNIGAWNVVSLTNADLMFDGVTLSVNNYEALLVGWNNQNLNSNVLFSGGNSKYCSEEAHVARANMMNTATGDSWMITDAGRECVVPTCVTFTSPIPTTEVALDAAIAWNSVSSATGYRITIVDSAGTTIVNNVDLLTATTYTPSPNWELGTTYTVTVLPYNPEGARPVCSSMQFTTADIPNCVVFTSPSPTTEVALDAAITWNSVTTATGYRITIVDAAGTIIVDNVDLLTATTYTPSPNWSLGTTYTVTVISYNLQGARPTCSNMQFTTVDVPACITFTTPSPTTEVALDAAITWNSVATATGYRITIIDSAGTTIANNVDLLTATTYTPSPSWDLGTTYTVTVMPYNLQGTRPTCNSMQFTTANVPDCVTFTNPSPTTEVALDAVITWNSVATATGYRITIIDSAGTTIANNVDLLTATTYTPSPSWDLGTIYTVTVIPYNLQGSRPTCGNMQFTTVDVPACVTFINPSPTTEVALDAAITWNSAPTATGYRITVVDSAGTIIVDNEELLNVTTYTPSPNWELGTTYTVTVIPYNTLGESTGCNMEFTTVDIPDCVNITSPEHNQFEVLLNAGIAWDAIDGVIGYKITIGTMLGGNDIVDNEILDASITSYFLSSDWLEDTTYYVTVIAYNNQGDAENCTEIMFVTTAIPVCPEITAPSDTETGVALDANIEWRIVDHAIGYRVTIGTTPGGNEIEDNFNAMGNTYLTNGWQADTTYYVNMTAYNEQGESTNCTGISFTTENKPECVEIIEPEDEAVNVPLTSGISWLEIDNATGYRITIGTTPDGIGIIDNMDVGDTTNYVPSTIWELGVTYYVYVIAYNSLGDAENCTSITFTARNEVFIPDAFTPNGDGINDTFNIVNVESLFPEYEMFIYDRWGSSVYKGKNGWDGTPQNFRSYGSKKVTPGIYYVLLVLDKKIKIKKSILVEY